MITSGPLRLQLWQTYSIQRQSCTDQVIVRTRILILLFICEKNSCFYDVFIPLAPFWCCKSEKNVNNVNYCLPGCSS
ncbi:hypothetical protein ACSBR2_005860 [Camellia fascicularis]